MVARPQYEPQYMTVEEYFAFDEASEYRHEYIDGYVYAVDGPHAMAGGSENHSLIASSINAAFHSQRRGKNCRIYSADMRVRVTDSKYVYPDATIVCGDSQISETPPIALLNPSILIEVLSPSTELYDRVDKFAYYRNIASVQEYLLVSQHEARIEGFSRQESGLWTFKDAVGLDATYDLMSYDFSLVLADVYEQIEFDDNNLHSNSPHTSQGET